MRLGIFTLRYQLNKQTIKNRQKANKQSNLLILTVSCEKRSCLTISKNKRQKKQSKTKTKKKIKQNKKEKKTKIGNNSKPGYVEK